MLKTEFWKKAAGALPAFVRDRHIGDIARAERFEILLDGVVDTVSEVKVAISKLLVRPTHQH